MGDEAPSTSKSSQESSEKENLEQPQIAQEVYQIRPSLEDKFKPVKAKEEIHNVLFEYLSQKKYDKDNAKQWTQEIAQAILGKVKQLKFKNYKFLVNVVLGERNGAGVQLGTRCIWDAEADAYAHESFTNDTIFCNAAVYAVYKY